MLDSLARRLLKAERPVIVVGDEIVKSDALEAAAAFAEALGAPVYQQSVRLRRALPVRAAPATWAASRATRSQVRGVLSKFDLMVVLGADPVRMSVWSEVEALPEGMPVVHIGLVDWDMGKNFAAEMAVRADLRETLLALTPVLAKVGGDRLAREGEGRGWPSSPRATGRPSAPISSPRFEGRAKPSRSIRDWLTLQIANALPRDAVVVNEGLTSSRHLTDLVPYRDRYGFHALASGGIGWGLPAAVGVALAQAPRPVCCFSGDGSAMYSIQSLWTAAHHEAAHHLRDRQQRRLPHHQAAPARPSTATTTSSAWISSSPRSTSPRSPSRWACRPSTSPSPTRVAPALRRAFSTPGPKLLDVVVDGKV